MKIRFATNADQTAIVELIDGVLREYDDAICLEGSEAELLNVQASYFDKGGAFWVIAQPESEHSEHAVFGTHAVLPDPGQPGVCVFTRLYLAQELRGTTWGHRLMQTNIDWATEQGMKRVEFWSDTRFTRAHRFFEKFGFEKSGDIRTMNDSHETYQEYFFFLNLN